MSKERNRGKLSNDDKWFATKWHPTFTDAVDDLSHLQSRGYADNSALQIVGNRYRLNKRQRNAILRVACGSTQIRGRQSKKCTVDQLVDQHIEIDGFNQLILLESALSGAFLFKGRDGVYRDISSVHGSYKRVQNTENAIYQIGTVLKECKVKSVKWYFDQPVSNSGRLKTKLMEISRLNQFNWEVELVFDPDKVLAQSPHIIISSDGWVLDQASRWFNLFPLLLNENIDQNNILEI